MHIAFAPIKLKPGVSEEEFLRASEDFELHFVKKQKGILRRILVKDDQGDYADLVFFEDSDAISRVVKAEMSGPALDFMSLIRDDSGDHRVFEVLKTYE